MLSKYSKFLASYKNTNWSVPFFLAFLCLFSFGILIPWLGFYWDDWAKILVYRLQGLDYYWPYYVGDRPFSAWTHIVLTPILGVKPAAWQIFTLSMRFLSAWGIYFLLVLLRPDQKRPAIIAAGIFTVYPLFSQQAISVTFHQQWMQFALIIASFDCMLLALRSPRHRFAWTGFSILLSVLQLSITEYFAPLELLRPFILWFAVSEKNHWKEKIRRSFVESAPYLILIVCFFVWRIFLMPQPGDNPYRADTLFNFVIKPIETIIWLIKTLVVDLTHIFFGSWSEVFNSKISAPLSFSFLAALGVSIFAGVIAFFYFHKTGQKVTDENDSNTWVRMAITIGTAGALLGPIPAWITGRQVLFDFHSDRFAMASLLGLSILFAGLIEWLGKSRLQKAALASVIIMLGCGYQVRTAIDYRNVWTQQMRLYWQLNWRAPRLKSPTAIYSENELIPNQGLFSMSGAINQLYPQDNNKELMDFWFFTLRPKYNAGPPKSMSLSNDSTFRTLHYIGNSPNTLLVNLDPSHGNCLWILRPEDQQNPYLSDMTRAFLPISNLERINPEPAPGFPPAELFGTEPARDWCYFFQKAELAWQEQNWEEIVRIGDEMLRDGFSPLSAPANSPREWWPLIVGYAQSGQVRQAIELSQQSLQQDKRYHESICHLWKNMQDVPEIGVGISELGCPEP